MKFSATFSYIRQRDGVKVNCVRVIEAPSQLDAEYKIKDEVYNDIGYNLEITELYVL